MANYTKTDPVAIDTAMQKIQKSLYDGLAYPNVDGYGRSYTIEKNDKDIPAYFNKGRDYKELLPNDRSLSNGHFFFVENETEFKNTIGKAKTDIIFLLNVEKLKPQISHRADEEVTSDIIGILERHKAFELKSLIKGLEVLKDYDHDLAHLQPYFFLKLSGILSYEFNC